MSLETGGAANTIYEGLVDHQFGYSAGDFALVSSESALASQLNRGWTIVRAYP